MWDPGYHAHNFYRETLDILEEAKVPVLVGGAFAQEYFTGISRVTKDLDLFLMERDLQRAFAALNHGGFRTEIAFSHWLGKAYDRNGGDFVDIIFNSGNGLCKVDESWFDRAPAGEAFGRPVKFCPVEESIWQKAFIMERERYDGADIAHLLRAQSDKLDWNRLLRRFGKHWRVLLSYVSLFGYIYPTERTRIPDWVQRKLSNLFACEIGQDARGESVCAGTLLSARAVHRRRRPMGLSRYQNAGFDEPGSCRTLDCGRYGREKTLTAGSSMNSAQDHLRFLRRMFP